MNEFEKYVMSLDKFKNRKPVFVFQLDENGDYDNRDVYDLHHAWTASAQRESYKLVPLDPPEGMDMKICDLVNHRVDVFEADRIYKAMIGVVDSPLSFALNHTHNKLKENADRLIKHQDSQMGAAE